MYELDTDSQPLLPKLPVRRCCIFIQLIFSVRKIRTFVFISRSIVTVKSLLKLALSLSSLSLSRLEIES